jgi:NAD-dependent dihydropyrimidine dehydrogenase PreA subunit
MGIQRIAEEKCNGCRKCVRVCPEDVLRFDERSRTPVVSYIRDCQCFLCELACAEEAITVTPYRERRTVRPW